MPPAERYVYKFFSPSYSRLYGALYTDELLPVARARERFEEHLEREGESGELAYRAIVELEDLEAAEENPQPPLEVQSVLLAKDRFRGMRAADGWIRDHDFNAGHVDETDAHWRYRQRSPKAFRAADFRTMRIAPGVQFIMGHLEARRTNPAHRIPSTTARLGEALDLVIERDGERQLLRDEVRGLHLLAPPDAFDRSPGHGKLYLVRGELAQGPLEGRERAARAYERWSNDRRRADRVGKLDVPDAVDVPLGRVVRIGYRSDKFGGKPAAYEHDFEDPRPLAFSTGSAHPRAVVISGGGFTVNARGIVG